MICRICQKWGKKVEMGKGRAIQQTWTAGLPDFPGDTDTSNRCQTMGPGGPGELVPCLKCPECGYSVTTGDA